MRVDTEQDVQIIDPISECKSYVCDTACSNGVFFPHHLQGHTSAWQQTYPNSAGWCLNMHTSKYVHNLKCSFNGYKSGDKSCVLLKMWWMSAAREHTRVCPGAHVGHQHSTSIIIGDPLTPAPGWSPTLGRGHDSFLSFSILKHLFWLRRALPLPNYRVFKIMGSPVGSGCLLVYTVIFFAGNRIGD